MISARNFAALLGLVLSLAALSIFVLLLADVLNEAELRQLFVQHWGVMLIAIALYLVAYVPMTAAWIGLARAAGAAASPKVLSRILFVSQIAKYIPGNIAHFVGRAYLARRSGVAVGTTGLAIALELAGVLAASGVLAVVAMLFGVAGSVSAQLSSWALGIAAALAVLGSAWILHRNTEKVKRLVGPFLWAIGLYSTVLLLLAAINAMLVSVIGGSWSLSVVGQVAGAFVVSWLIGFATPGSPAGIGLRELTFFGLLADSIPHETLLLTAVAFRLTTIVGDLIVWLVGLIIPGRKDGPEIPKPMPL